MLKPNNLLYLELLAVLLRENQQPNALFFKLKDYYLSLLISVICASKKALFFTHKANTLIQHFRCCWAISAASDLGFVFWQSNLWVFYILIA